MSTLAYAFLRCIVEYYLLMLTKTAKLGDKFDSLGYLCLINIH